jgi:hypothetical protein
MKHSYSEIKKSVKIEIESVKTIETKAKIKIKKRKIKGSRLPHHLLFQVQVHPIIHKVKVLKADSVKLNI